MAEHVSNMTKSAGLRTFLWAIVCLFGFAVVCYVTARSYLAYQASRAGSMLRELRSVKVGDPESSIISISENYGGYQWIWKVRDPNDQRSDYEYVLEANPWRFPMMTGHTRKVDNAIRAASSSLNSRLRRTVGLRMWNVTGTITLKENRVTAVSGSASVEGRDQWLGGLWHLSESIPEYKLKGFRELGVPWPEINRCLIGWANLNMADGLGEAVDSWITPSAMENEQQYTRLFNIQCLTSLSGCRTVCELMPEAVAYAKEHPHVISSDGGTWDSATGVCTAPGTDRYW
jgi:hypothetical protein